MSVLGSSALTLAFAGCTRQDEPLPERIRRWTEREESWKSSICRLCPGGCGLKARVVDGRVVQVPGNPLHPVNRGGICPRGLAAMDALYDADRITTPMRQVGGKGSGRWEPVSWDEAMNLLASRLGDLRAAGTPEGLVLLDGQESGLRERMTGRFARAFGTPNHIRYRNILPEEISLTHELMQGGEAPLAYDLSRVSHILCFGTGLLESWISPVLQMRAVADLHGVERGNRGRLVVANPRMSVTAARADQWVPIRPGTEGALALGIAHVILRESLYDRAFVESWTFGFDDWVDEGGQRHLGFKNLVLSDYNPLAVSQITGVRTETILGLAREFAGTKPALALGEPEFSSAPNDFYHRMAIHALNALTGNLAGPGTFSVQGRPPTIPPPEPVLDAIARTSLSKRRVDRAGQGGHFLAHHAVQALPDAVMTGRPYPVGVLLLLDVNPVFSHPAKEEFAQALTRVPLVVSTSSHLDESAEFSDLVLPDANFLERWEAVESRHHAGFSLVSVGEPVVPPDEGVRDFVDVLFETAGRLGGSLAAAFPWKSSMIAVKDTCRGLFEARRGYVVAGPQEESFRRILEQQGFRDPEFDGFEEFWTALRSRGAWWDPTDSSDDLVSLIRNPSRRFEFYSRRLEERFRETVRREAGTDPAAQARVAERLRTELGVRVEGDRLFLPHHEVPLPRSEDARFGLRLHPYALLSLGPGQMANSPWIQEGLAVHVAATWDSWVELSPDDAREAGIGDGDLIWIESPKGRIQARARVYAGTMPGVVAMPIGQGHRALGSQARGRGSNPFDLVDNVHDSRFGMGVLGSTPVRISKA